MFYNARWYDPVSGRFSQADSIIPEQSQGTQAWDRFAYTNNNPVRYTDPTGHCITGGLDTLICMFVAGALLLTGSVPLPEEEVVFGPQPEPAINKITTAIAPSAEYELDATLSVGGPDSPAEVFQDQVLDNLEFANTSFGDGLSLIADGLGIPGIGVVLDKLVNDPTGTE
jgi:hypothetical protein